MKTLVKPLCTNILGMVLLLSSSYLYAVPMLSFNVSDSAPAIGDTISVDIVATDVTDLFAFNLDIAFDSVILGVSAVVPGSFLSNGGLTLGDLGLLGFNTSIPGEIQDINDSLLGPIPGVTGTGVLASVAFDVIGSGVSSLSFLNVNALAGTELINSGGLPITITDTVGATVTVVPEPSTLFLIGTGIAGLLSCRRRKPL